MRRILLQSLLGLALSSAPVAAASIVYVTDLAIYTLLAPCAQYALSYNIQGQTASACGEAVSDLQSCVCTKNNNLAAISTEVSRSVSASCGSTASEDQASAQVVYSQYCNPDKTFTFATPTANLVTDYITDIPAFSNLAPCAQSGVSYAVSSMRSLCPEPASLMAPCVCGKNQNSLRVSQVINTSVKYSCSNSADITSAHQFFGAYCAMTAGTTAFPQPSPPPGDMTYYITALPQYSSLASCAQNGVSYAFKYQTQSLCPDGPQALASCICLKEGIYGIVSSSLTSDVKYYCTSTATEDVTSALAVMEFYCSAARKEVVATVGESIQQTYPAETRTTGSGGTGAKSTSTSTRGPGGADGSSNGGNGTNNSQSSVNVAVIAGSVAGVVGGLVLVGVAALIYKRKKKNRDDAAAAAAAQQQSSGGGFDMSGKPELAGTMLAAPPPGSPHPSMAKTGSPRTDNVSPVSAYGKSHPSAFTPPPMPSELHNQPPMPSELHSYGPMPSELHSQAPMTPELQGGQGYGRNPGLQLPPELQAQQHYQQYGQPMPSEMQGSQYPRPPGQPLPAEAYGQPIYQMPAHPQQQVYEAYGHPRAELQGGWQSGPTHGYQELDSNGQRR